MDLLIRYSKKEIDLFHKIVGQNVKTLRNARGMSQLDLAHAIGHSSVSVVSHGEICFNRKRFNLSHIYLIAKALNVHPCDLIDCGGQLFTKKGSKEER